MQTIERQSCSFSLPARPLWSYFVLSCSHWRFFCCFYCFYKEEIWIDNIFHCSLWRLTFFFIDASRQAILFVMLPFRGILFYWCSLVSWYDLYDNNMCCIHLLASHLLSCWFSYFHIGWRITCLLVCTLRRFSICISSAEILSVLFDRYKTYITIR